MPSIIRLQACKVAAWSSNAFAAERLMLAACSVAITPRLSASITYEVLTAKRLVGSECSALAIPLPPPSPSDPKVPSPPASSFEVRPVEFGNRNDHHPHFGSAFGRKALETIWPQVR